MQMTNVITSKGTTTIPKAIRDDLGLQQGDHVRFVKAESGKYEIEKDISIEEIRSLNAQYASNFKYKNTADLKQAIEDLKQAEFAQKFPIKSK